MIASNMLFRKKPIELDTMYNQSFLAIALIKKRNKPDQTIITSEISGRLGFLPIITPKVVGIVAE